MISFRIAFLQSRCSPSVCSVYSLALWEVGLSEAPLWAEQQSDPVVTNNVIGLICAWHLDGKILSSLRHYYGAVDLY